MSFLVSSKPANTENELLQPNLSLLWLMYYCVTELTNLGLVNVSMVYLFFLFDLFTFLAFLWVTENRFLAVGWIGEMRGKNLPATAFIGLCY